MLSIYEQMVAAGVQIGHHETDLYAIVCDASRRIVDEYEYKTNVETFVSQIDGKVWFDIPFAYLPAWGRGVSVGEACGMSY